MDHDFERGEVTFIDFPAAASAGAARSAAIATFARPAVPARVRAERAARWHEPARLLGNSAQIRAVAERLRRVATSQAAVMLAGESGTGKEVAAALLHAQSRRATEPFIAVNCSAIPASLAEAELFGYERGAFTGAVRQHEGYFERASGGTLFLDEITEMPVELQAKLLRVLETGRMHRVGGTEEIAVDVRIVTATNRSPEAAVRERALREDLYFRLAVIRVDLPPLRDRGDDVALLAQAFIDRLNRDYGAHKRFADTALDAARGYPWPGNVRELKNCVERSFVLSEDLVELDLPACARSADVAATPGDGVTLPIGTTMAQAERELLLATLRHCSGNRRKTAVVLGISLKTVYNKLLAYGVDATPQLRCAVVD